MNDPQREPILMSVYAYELIASYVCDLLRSGDHKGRDLLASAPRPRAERAQDDSSAGDDTRRESDGERIAA
jgi:hypothetical protein